MTTLQHFKVTALPANPVPDAVYFVKAAAGAPTLQFVTDSAGVAEPVVSLSRSLMFFSGRLYCFEDKRWVALTNRTYGPSYFQFNHSGGVGENPVKDYRAKSPYLKAGTIVDNITVDFRTDDQRIEDIEFYAALQRPWTQTDQITGLSSSNDVQEVIMHKDLLHSPAAAGQIQMSGDLRQNHVRTVPIGATVTKDSILKLAFAPRSTQPLPAILYGYLAITVSLIEPARAISTGTYVAPSPKK